MKVVYVYIMVNDNPFRIVILGAGYAGMFLATNLYQSFKEKSNGDRKDNCCTDDIEIILVDIHPYHQLLQEIHLVAAGYRTSEQIRIPITSLIDGTEIKFIQSNVGEICTDENKVVLDRTMIEYDVVVISLGSTTKYFGIEGAKTNTIPFRSIDDATAVNNRIQSLLLSKGTESRNYLEKNEDGKLRKNDDDNEDNNIVIVGGGATGVSLGGAIADFLKDQKTSAAEVGRSLTIKTNLNVTIVEASSNILSGWNAELVDKTSTILESKGVRILTNSEVSKIENDNLILKDNSIIDSSLIIWTAGIKGYEIKVTPQADRTKNGRIIVNRFCQMDKYPNVFVIGDIAAVKDSQGKIYPPIAQIAVREAKYLTDILHKHICKLNHENINIKNFMSLTAQEAFDYDIKVQILSLGIDDYIGLFGKHVINGNLAKMIDEFGELTYVKSLKTGGDVSSSMYEDTLLSKLIAGFSFAGFAFARWVGIGYRKYSDQI
jgi:NADH:ubiquinone reductase (H+-translocating)